MWNLFAKTEYVGKQETVADAAARPKSSYIPFGFLFGQPDYVQGGDKLSVPRPSDSVL